MLLLLYLVVKAQQYFVTSSFMFLDKKTVLQIWLNPGLNRTQKRLMSKVLPGVLLFSVGGM